MRLTQNPILHTHFTLAKRRGLHFVFIAVAALAAIMAWSYLDALADKMARVPEHWRVSPEEASLWMARDAYMTVLCLQVLSVVMGAVLAVTTIARDRRSRVLEANTLTPMTPADLAIGYWFGPLIPTLALSALGTAFGVFVAVVTPGMSLGTIFETQLMIYSGALVAGLMASLIGLSIQRVGAGVFSIIGAAVMFTYGTIGGAASLLNYVSGSVVVMRAFEVQRSLFRPVRNEYITDLFGAEVSGAMVALAIQGAFAWLLWVGLTRKLRSTRQRAIPRRVMTLAFTAAVFVQIALAWHWLDVTSDYQARFAHAIIMCGAFVAAATLALGASATPEEIRSRLASNAPGRWLANGPVTGVLLSLITTSLVVAVPIHVDSVVWLGALDAAASIAILTLLAETSRFSNNPRAGTFTALVVGVLFLAPLVFSIVLMDDEFAMASFLLSAGLLLNGEDDGSLFAAVGLHVTLALILVPVWLHGIRSHEERVRTVTTRGA